MEPVIIDSHDAFAAFLNKEIGVSDYHKITQEQVNGFADATLDHQWIHLDNERAAKESPFGGTIAHGYMTLSLTPYLWGQIAKIENLKMMINYGIEKLKFNQPVLVGQEVRLRASLAEIMNLRGVTKATLKIELQIKDNPKPAFTALALFLYHFKS